MVAAVPPDVIVLQKGRRVNDVVMIVDVGDEELNYEVCRLNVSVRSMINDSD